MSRGVLLKGAMSVSKGMAATQRFWAILQRRRVKKGDIIAA